MHDLVHPAQEGDRLEVLVPAELVRDPFSGVSRIVEVEHGGHRVHAQPVDMVFLQPEQDAREEKVCHLPAAVVEDQLSRVRVLVEVRPIEECESVGVLREVGGDPVDEDPDPLPVATVDEGHEVVREAVAGGRGEKPKRLIPPRAVKRMLRDGEKLDVRVSHLPDVGGEIVRQFPFLPLPRPEVDFVDRDGLLQKISRAPAGHPLAVPPGVSVDVANDRARPGRVFVPEGVRVGLEEQIPRLPGADLVLVDLPLAKPGDKNLPDAALPSVAHRVPAAVPVVKIPHHGHPPGVGGPHGKGDPCHPPHLREVAPELAVQLEMGPLPEQVDVEVREDAVEPVRVLLLPAVAFVVFDLDPVGEEGLPAGEDRLEDAFGMKPSHLRAALLSVGWREHEGTGRVRKDRTDGDRFPRPERDDVWSEHGERVPVPRLHEPLDILLVHGSGHIVHCIVSDRGLPPKRREGRGEAGATAN
jgi:hypothetical protein